MPWNPEVYNKFRENRVEPFYNLINNIHGKPDVNILDLGCGTGELTKILADKFDRSKVLGVDTFTDMLEKAPVQKNISFIINRRALELYDKWDVIVANASLQWVNEHDNFFEKMISKLFAGG